MSADDFSPDSNDAVAWYDENAEAIVERHESLAPEKVNAWLATFYQTSRLSCWTSEPARDAMRLGWLPVATR